MSQFSGKQDFTGTKNGRKNKGVMRARIAEKREEAESRNDLYAIRNATENPEETEEDSTN